MKLQREYVPSWTLVRRLARLSIRGLACGPHLTRYAMYRRLAQSVPLPRTPGVSVLAISGSRTLCTYLGIGTGNESSCVRCERLAAARARITEANYPEANILALPYADDSFDVVVSDQVLEHVEGDPRRAIEETRRVLKPGGIAVHTTCLLNPVHAAPGDYWRYTPDALRLLCSGFSDIVECGGWGNEWVTTLLALGLRSVPIPHARWHPLHWLATRNHPNWPLMVWVVARK